jgi:glutamate-ammonia-ligase adenylyltransferase
LLDDLLNPSMLYKPLDREHLEQELSRDLERIAADDAEQQINALRHFKQTNVLRVAAADISGTMRLMIVSDYLTEIAEVLLRRILEIAWNDLLKRFGAPRCLINGEARKPELAIIGYGKLGGVELSYRSDLDLVFLHDSAGEHQYTTGPKEIDNVSFFAKLAQRMIHMISTHTAAGVLYEVDTRLRPSGRSGLLVSSFEAFAEYQQKQAWTWEHQALVRARFISGPEKLKQRFTQLRLEILCRPRDRRQLREEVRRMRERMRTELGSRNPDTFDIKQDRGGIADIEFMVQFLVLAYAHEYPELTRYSDNIRQLAGLELTEVLPSGDVAQLRDSYRALRQHVHLTTLQEQADAVPDGKLDEHRRAVTHLWERLMTSETD